VLHNSVLSYFCNCDRCDELIKMPSDNAVVGKRPVVKENILMDSLDRDRDVQHVNI
jgi:hypothetical protein